MATNSEDEERLTSEFGIVEIFKVVMPNPIFSLTVYNNDEKEEQGPTEIVEYFKGIQDAKNYVDSYRTSLNLNYGCIIRMKIYDYDQFCSMYQDDGSGVADGIVDNTMSSNTVQLFKVFLADGDFEFLKSLQDAKHFVNCRRHSHNVTFDNIARVLFEDREEYRGEYKEDA
jgi:hypothetical protein